MCMSRIQRHLFCLGKMQVSIPLVILVCALATVYAGLNIAEILAANPRLIDLGNVDGKSFFAHHLTIATWSASKNYCEGLGMTMASITTEAQLDYLKSKYDAADFRGGFWTGGRDVMSKAQFAWDNDGAPLADFLPFNYFHSPQTCVYYYSDVGNQAAHGKLDSYSCLSYANGVLCEA